MWMPQHRGAVPPQVILLSLSLRDACLRFGVTQPSDPSFLSPVLTLAWGGRRSRSPRTRDLTRESRAMVPRAPSTLLERVLAPHGKSHEGGTPAPGPLLQRAEAGQAPNTRVLLETDVASSSLPPVGRESDPGPHRSITARPQCNMGVCPLTPPGPQRRGGPLPSHRTSPATE